MSRKRSGGIEILSDQGVAALLDASGSGDLEELRYSLDSWSKTAGTRFGFKGPNGQMYLNQLAKDGQVLDVAAQLAKWFQPTTSGR